MRLFRPRNMSSILVPERYRDKRSEATPKSQQFPGITSSQDSTSYRVAPPLFCHIFHRSRSRDRFSVQVPLFVHFFTSGTSLLEAKVPKTRMDLAKKNIHCPLSYLVFIFSNFRSFPKRDHFITYFIFFDYCLCGSFLICKKIPSSDR